MIIGSGREEGAGKWERRVGRGEEWERSWMKEWVEARRLER